MKQLLKLLQRFKILLLLLLFGSCGLLQKNCISVLEIEEMEEIKKQIRLKDSSLSQMSIEEFQAIAQKYFGNTRIRVEPFSYVGKNKVGVIMQKEGELYYVQSFTGRGENNEIKIGIKMLDETYFISDITTYLIINDFVCDEMTVENVGGDVNLLYAVGWKAVIY